MKGSNAEEHFKVSVFYAALDAAIAQVTYRFQGEIIFVTHSRYTNKIYYTSNIYKEQYIYIYRERV